MNILVPFDSSRSSALAMECALEMAASHRTRITLVHALQLNLSSIGPANPSDHRLALCREALAQAGPFLEKARERDIQAACLIEDGPPAKAIAGAERQCKPDLIIVSKRPRGRLARWFGRGTVEQVTRTASCPVLVLPGTETRAANSFPITRS